MSILKAQVRRAHRRLGFNVLLDRFALALIAAAGAWALVVLVERLFALGLPLDIVNYAALGVLVALTLIGVYLRRVTELAAAVALDEAASLKERCSSAIVVDARQMQSDPFAQALVRDAEAIAGKVHVPRAVPLRAPALWPWSAATVATAVLLFFFMPQLKLFSQEAKAGTELVEPRISKQESQKLAAAVNQQINRMKEMSKDKPGLSNLADALKPIEMPEKASVKPEDVQRDAIKVLDQLSDRLEQKRADEKIKGVEQIKQLLAQLEKTKPDHPASKLTEALSKGDFHKAAEELRELQKEVGDLAKNASPEAQEKMKKMQESMEKLAEDLKKLNNDEKLQKDLQNKAGLSEQDAKKLLDEMSKMDPKDIAKELQKRLGEKSNMTPEQMKEMAQKLMQNAEAKKQLEQIAKKMAESAEAMKECQKCQGNKQGQQGNKQGDQQGKEGQQQAEQQGQKAAQAMSDAGQQMSEMEMSEQMMNEMEAQMQELDDLRKQMNDGQDGKGQGNGDDEEKEKKDGKGTANDYGRGYGAGTGKEKAAHKMKTERVKAPMQRGEIIGQMLFDGPQVKGEATAAVRDAVNSAVRDATDAINRDEVPRQYERAVREYFDGLAGLMGAGGAPLPAAGDKKDAAEKDAPEQRLPAKNAGPGAGAK